MESPLDHGPREPRPARWRAPVAWLVIAAACTLWAARPWDGEEGAGGDAVGLVIARIQATYLVGVARLLGTEGAPLYTQARTTLDAGTVGQRQRFVLVAAELAGPGEARQRLEELDATIADPPVGPPPELDEAELHVQQVLHALFPPELADAEPGEARRIARDAASSLSPADRSRLAALGWFGELSLQGEPRSRALRSAADVALVLIGAAIAGGLAVMAGFAGLVLVVVLVATGRLASGLGAARAPHVLYAETFAIWLVLFMGLQLVIGNFAPASLHMAFVAAAFPLSLCALVWPVLQGAAWNAVRHDVGLTLGRNPSQEALLGAGGYLVTLPLLGVGVLLTLGLIVLQQLLSPEPPTFSPAGGPAHPVIVEMSGSAVWPKLQIMALAVLAAPLVEETMFRGVLYRHLRGATAHLGGAMSIAIGTAGNTFVFAAIHPQGAVAIPALMSLATGMTLLREWRGTLLPAMIVHGISNGLVMCLLWALLGM